MIILDLWEWSINLFLVGCGVLLMGIGSFFFVLIISAFTDWRTNGKSQ